MAVSDTANEYYRCFASVDLSAIEHNLHELKSCLAEGVLAMAVVKADAYGHGARRVAPFIEPLVDYFAVATLEEGIELRDVGITKPILVLSYTAPAQYVALIKHGITATVYDLGAARELSTVAEGYGKKAKIHICVDTGMGRIGFFPNDASADIVKEISLLGGIYLEGIFSHFACADAIDKSETKKQTEIFNVFLEKLRARGVDIPIRHFSNSAGVIESAEQYDMCRLGIAMYGIYPSEEVTRSKVKLIPAMEVASHVIHVKDVPAGYKIGYSHAYTAPSARRIATVCIGYADGFNRCMSCGGYVLIRGRRAPVVGRVCMDNIMVDVTDIPEVFVGECAVVLGRCREEIISAEMIGELCSSFAYEVLCNFSPRVKRLYYESKFRKFEKRY